MAKHSAGLLMYRYRQGVLEVFLVHPGGPFWAGKDLGAWSIPKGEYRPDETPVDAARREFGEETACPSTGDLLPLTPLRPAGAIPSPWNGPPAPAGGRNSRRWTGRAGSPWTKRRLKFPRGSWAS